MHEEKKNLRKIFLFVFSQNIITKSAIFYSEIEFYDLDLYLNDTKHGILGIITQPEWSKWNHPTPSLSPPSCRSAGYYPLRLRKNLLSLIQGTRRYQTVCGSKKNIGHVDYPGSKMTSLTNPRRHS